MRHAIAVLLAAFTAAGTAIAGDVYRCVDRGRVEYSDRPCGDAVVLDTAPQGISLSSSYALVSGVESGLLAPIARGMSPREVYAAMGRPRDMEVRIEGIAPAERWYYRIANRTATVKFQYGQVTDIELH